MQVDPESEDDQMLRAMAGQTRRLLDDLLGYVDVLPPKMTLAQMRTLKGASDLLKEYNDDVHT